MPLNLSGDGSEVTPSRPQSTRPLFCSTDMINKSPTIETSPWPAGQITDDFNAGIPSLSSS